MTRGVAAGIVVRPDARAKGPGEQVGSSIASSHSTRPAWVAGSRRYGPLIQRCQLHKIRNVEAKLPAALARHAQLA
jgi:hypothetical protein